MHKMKQESKQEGKKKSTFPDIRWRKIAMLTLMRYIQDNHLNISKLLKH